MKHSSPISNYINLAILIKFRRKRNDQQKQPLPYASEYHQLNPLLNAAAQQFAVDTTTRNAWANAAAAAALFASQLQQQNSGSFGIGCAQLQQAAALNLVSLQNFPFVDYARMMHLPNRLFYSIYLY